VASATAPATGRAKAANLANSLRDPEKLRVLGARLHGDDKINEAIAAYQAYLAYRPDDAGIWSNLGVALRKQQKFQAAIACYRRAIELAPGDPGFHGNLGNVLKDLDRMEESLAAHEVAVAGRPKDSGIRYNYAIALREAARFEAALEQLDLCLASEPENTKMQWDRALVLLHLGRTAEGWQAYAARKQIGELPTPPYDAPPWRGEDPQGKTILVFPEQGFGDAIMASRFVPLIAARGATVWLECKPPLWRLFEGLEGVTRRVKPGEVKQGIDYHGSIMDLPAIFSADPSNLPPPPRLTVPEESRGKARGWLAPAGERFKVGICWAGSLTHKNDRKRSVSIERFLALAEIPGLQLYSLYKGPLEGQIRASGAPGLILDIGSLCEDFADTAAVIEGLDLVVMIDSAVAHLAGSLGRPVWNLISYCPDWRYGEGAERTPWYQSMRVLRQPRPGDWDSLFARVRADLEQAVAAKRAGRWPE